MEDRVLADSDGMYWLSRLLAAEGAQIQAREMAERQGQNRRRMMGRG